MEQASEDTTDRLFRDTSWSEWRQGAGQIPTQTKQRSGKEAGVASGAGTIAAPFSTNGESQIDANGSFGAGVRGRRLAELCPERGHPSRVRFFVAPLSPRRLFVGLSGPLDLERDGFVVSLCEDVGSPLLSARGLPLHLASRGPPCSSGRFEYYLFEVQVLWAFVFPVAIASGFVREETCPQIRPLENDFGFAAWHDQVSFCLVVRTKLFPPRFIIGWGLDISSCIIHASQRHIFFPFFRLSACASARLTRAPG